jgi:hypothetical protein
MEIPEFSQVEEAVWRSLILIHFLRYHDFTNARYKAKENTFLSDENNSDHNVINMWYIELSIKKIK